MLDHTNTPRRFQCRHIFTGGRRCGSPCLRNEDFCYYHHTTRRPAPNTRHDAYNTPPSETVLTLPTPEDATAIQLSVGEIMNALARNSIDPRRAGLLLYALQIASQNLQRAQPRSKMPPRQQPIVEEITIDPTLGTLAPASELDEDYDFHAGTETGSPTLRRLVEKMEQLRDAEPAPTPTIDLNAAATPEQATPAPATPQQATAAQPQPRCRPAQRSRPNLIQMKTLDPKYGEGVPRPKHPSPTPSAGDRLHHHAPNPPIHGDLLLQPPVPVVHHVLHQRPHHGNPVLHRPNRARIIEFDRALTSTLNLRINHSPLRPTSPRHTLPSPTTPAQVLSFSANRNHRTNH